MKCTHGRKHVKINLVAQEERRVRLPCLFAPLQGYGSLVQRSIDRGLMLHHAHVRIERSILSCLLRRARYNIRYDTNNDQNNATTHNDVKRNELRFVSCRQVRLLAGYISWV
jgi:hypothetical protein